MAFLTEIDGELTPNEEASKLDWFTELPENIHGEQADFLRAKKLAR